MQDRKKYYKGTKILLFVFKVLFDSFGLMAVQAAQFLVIFGRHTCVKISCSNFLARQGM